MKIVDPANPIPKYLQISTWLKNQIQNGAYRTGDRIPTELELSRLCGVNRNTLRQAISELVSEGLLRKEKGVGSFVSSTRPVALKHKLSHITSFRDDLQEQGLTEHSRILKKSAEKPGHNVTQALNIGDDSRVVVIRRLRTGDEIPLIYEESYLSADSFGRILNMDLTGSMYKILSEKFRISLNRCEQTIQAINLKGKIARYLNLTENAAGIFMKSITYDDSNRPIEVLYSYYRGDRYVFEVELGRYHITEKPLKN